MKPHVHATNRWDVLTIVVVMRALLHDVFARFMPDHFHAKELLDGIQRVVYMRTGRAHRVALTESDVLETLRQMVAVVRRCAVHQLAFAFRPTYISGLCVRTSMCACACVCACLSVRVCGSGICSLCVRTSICVCACVCACLSVCVCAEAAFVGGFAAL